MFRPTYFVILFAVVVCANALPADPSTAIPERPTRAVEPAGSLDLTKKEPVKADLDTDATVYLPYGRIYNGFRLADHSGIYIPRAYPWSPYYY